MDWDDFGNDFVDSQESSDPEGFDESYESFNPDEFSESDIDISDNADFGKPEIRRDSGEVGQLEHDQEDQTKQHRRIGNLFGYDDEDDRGSRPRTQRQKMMDAFIKCVNRIGRCIVEGGHGDWLSARIEFESLEKEREKASKYIEGNGFPGIYLNGFTTLYDAAIERWENTEVRKSLNRDNARELTKVVQALKQKVKDDEELRESIAAYRENPDDFEDAEDEDFSFLEMSSDKDEADDDYFSKDISYWYEFSEEDEKEKRERRIGPGKKKDIEEDEGREIWTLDRIDKLLNELVQQRGSSKLYRKQESILMLEFLWRKKKGLKNRLQIAFHIINAIFDSSTSGDMTFKQWKYVYHLTIKILNTMFKYNDKFVLLTNEDSVPPSDKAPIFGSFVGILSKLDEELYKALQQTEANTKKYVSRYEYINYLLLLSRYIEKYERENGRSSILCYFIQLKHLHYRTDLPTVIAPVENSVILEEAPGEPIDDDTPESEILNGELEIPAPARPNIDFFDNLNEAIHVLTSFLYQHADGQLKTTAVLYHVYHLALHSKYYQARDLLMMTHIPDKIHEVDVSIQSLYNRCMAQLGIAAFKELKMSDVYACINDLLIGGRCKELIAQGVSHRLNDGKSPEEEIKERSRQYPYHMHINIDVLEAIILLASAILNVSNLSQSRTKKSLKYFRKALEGYKRNIFIGPPENTRERIIYASEKLFNGEWKNCQKVLDDLDIWNYFDESIKTGLYELIQEESLKSFLFTSGQYYDSLSIDLLAERFQLDRELVYSIIAKAIFTQKLHASLDQVHDCVILRAQKSTEVNNLAQKYVERLSAF